MYGPARPFAPREYAIYDGTIRQDMPRSYLAIPGDHSAQLPQRYKRMSDAEQYLYYTRKVDTDA
jgi:hypothetical protein